MPPQATIGVRLKIQGKQALKQVKTLGGRINQALGKVRPIASMLGGVGGVYMLQNLARKTIDFDLALTRMSIQARKGKDVQADLRSEMMNVSEETGIAKDQIGAMGQSVIDATGDFDFMRKVLRDAAIMSQATGADMGGLGNIVSDLKNNFNLTGEEASAMLRKMAEAGERGKFTLPEMAQAGARAMAAMKIAGVENTDEIMRANAALQVMRRNYASADMTTTAYLSTVSTLAKKSKQLEKKGIKVFEDDDPSKMRALDDVLTDIFENVGTGADELLTVFTAENVAGIGAMATAFKEAKKEGTDLEGALSKFTDVTGKSERWQKELNRVLDTTGGKLMTFQQKLDRIFDDAMMKNVDELAGYLPEITKILKYAVDNKEAILAFWAAQKLGGLGGGGGAATTAAAAAGGAGTKAARGVGVSPAGYTSWAAAIAAGIGIGIAGAEVSKGHEKATSDFASEIERQEQATGEKMSKWEKIKMLFSGLNPSAGTGSPWQSPTEEAEKQIELSREAVKSLEEAVRKGASKAKPQIFIPNPMQFAGGSTGKPVHGG